MSQLREGVFSCDPDRLQVEFGRLNGGKSDGEPVACFHIHRKDLPDFCWSVTKDVAEKIIRAMACFVNDEYGPEHGDQPSVGPENN